MPQPCLLAAEGGNEAVADTRIFLTPVSSVGGGRDHRELIAKNQPKLWSGH